MNRSLNVSAGVRPRCTRSLDNPNQSPNRWRWVGLVASAALYLWATDARAATVWNGPTITFTKLATADHTLPANQDRITANVWLTRGASQGLYNIKTESFFTHNSSPAGTRWASGTTANHAALTYTDWETWARSVGNPPAIPGVDAVLHLVADDIYIDIKFLSWSMRSGGFSYQRSTAPPMNQPPTVSITSPADGTAMSTPADLAITANASDPGGSVASVEFFDGTSSLGVDAGSPYSVNASFYPGVYSLTAVATDNTGLKGTSAVVSLTVTSTPIANPIVDRIPKGSVTVELRTIADGMISPVGMALPDDGSGRMFVCDQGGLVWIVTASGRLPAPLLDIRGRLVNLSGAYDERGLLGLAVHPNFTQNPLIYTYSSEPNAGIADFPTTLPPGATNNHQSVIAEWRISVGNPNLVDPASRREILRIDQPQSNHNGGALRFGPDGFLYVSLGDGGQADDQGNGHPAGGNGQDITTVLGSLLRIDVDARTSANGQYGVPADNPFVGTAGLDEIYAYGLRNPFNFHFEMATGLLYLSDVGQNKVEEINLVVKGGNYGWPVKEGSFFFDPNGAAAGFVTGFPARPVPPNLTDPIAEYDHDDGTSVIGGTVYHGTDLPDLVNRYVFGDWGTFGAPSGRLFYLDGSAIKELRLGLEDRPLGLYLKGFGEDAAGELYLLGSKPIGPTGLGGVMMKLVPPPSAPLAISSAVATNDTNIHLAWTGGRGPFAVQRKLALTEPVCMPAAYRTASTLTAPQRGSSGFFRVLDTARQPAIPLTAHLNGANERPANLTTGTGSAILSLEGNTLKFSVNYRGLTGNATLAHIHGITNTTGSAGVLVDLAPYNGGAFGSSGTLSGTIVLSDAHKAAMLAGLTYLNIHTAANPGGEIRGQIAPVLMEASLLAAYESPAIEKPARGFASFMLVGSQLTFNIRYEQLSSAATLAHIHGPAVIGQNAGVLIDLAPFNGGAGTVAGTVVLTPAQRAAVIDGHTYVNFHTPAHPGGELRGQVVPQATGIPLSAWISGLNERPTPLTNTAAGLGLFSLEGDKLAFNITYSGLSGPATLAHIHGPANTSAAIGVQVDLAPYHGGAFGSQGMFSGSVVLTPAQRAMILNGLAYVNIHTAAHPGGETRGHISTVLLSAGADGAAERPTAVVSTGAALGQFALVGNQLDFNITYRHLSGPASMAHIHAPALASATAGVVVDFAPFNGGAYGVSGSVQGSTTLPATVLAHLIDGLGYINFHTGANPPGEIRGQMVRP